MIRYFILIRFYISPVNFWRANLSFSSGFDGVFVVKKIIVSWSDRCYLTDTVISTSVYCHPGGWCSYNSYGSLFLADGKGDDSWRAGDCDVTHVKGQSLRKVKRDRQTAWFKEPFHWWMLPQPVRHFHDSSRVTFSKAIGFTSVSSFLLSPVIGQSQLEDAVDLWLLRSNVRIDPVIPLRKTCRKRKISKWIIRQST